VLFAQIVAGFATLALLLESFVRLRSERSSSQERGAGRWSSTVVFALVQFVLLFTVLRPSSNGTVTAAMSALTNASAMVLLLYVHHRLIESFFRQRERAWNTLCNRTSGFRGRCNRNPYLRRPTFIASDFDNKYLLLKIC